MIDKKMFSVIDIFKLVAIVSLIYVLVDANLLANERMDEISSRDPSYYDNQTDRQLLIKNYERTAMFGIVTLMLLLIIFVTGYLIAVIRL